jgi:hypothetical protein
MAISWWQAGSGWLGGSAADLLADKDDRDAAGQFLMHLQDLPDSAVLPARASSRGRLCWLAEPAGTGRRGEDGSVLVQLLCCGLRRGLGTSTSMSRRLLCRAPRTAMAAGRVSAREYQQPPCQAT